MGLLRSCSLAPAVDGWLAPSAGQPFSLGGPDPWTLMIDESQMPWRSEASRCPDAAETKSSRAELRALSIDAAKPCRRAQSEQPRPARTSAELGFAAEGSGVRSSLEVLQPSEADAQTKAQTLICDKTARQALRGGDFGALAGRRHFSIGRSHCSSECSRLAATVLGAIDIDSHPGRGRQLQRAPPEDLAALPWGPGQESSQSNAVPLQPARRTSAFEHQLAAERYAALLGRPLLSSSQHSCHAESSSRLQQSKPRCQVYGRSQESDGRSSTGQCHGQGARDSAQAIALMVSAMPKGREQLPLAFRRVLSSLDLEKDPPRLPPQLLVLPKSPPPKPRRRLASSSSGSTCSPLSPALSSPSTSISSSPDLPSERRRPELKAAGPPPRCSGCPS